MSPLLALIAGLRAAAPAGEPADPPAPPPAAESIPEIEAVELEPANTAPEVDVEVADASQPAATPPPVTQYPQGRTAPTEAAEPSESIVTSEGADPAPLDENSDKAKKKKKKKKERKIDWKGRVVGGYRLKITNPDANQAATASTKHSIQLRQVRVAMKGKFRDVLTLRVSADFADLLEYPGPGSVLRDAWANVEVHELFQIKVGEFKRPYSALELRGVSGLHLVSRGLFNSNAVEDLGWGDRSTGAMQWGNTKPKKPGLHRMSWAFSATNDATSGAQDNLDLHARVTYAPIKLVTVGVGGAMKYVEDFTGFWRHAYGGGADVTLKHKGLRVGVEADLAQDWSYQEMTGERVNPNILGTLGYLSYAIELSNDWVLQPAATFEYTDTNMLYGQSESIRAVGNFNVSWTDQLMLRPQVEWVHPVGGTTLNQFIESQVYGLWLQVQI